MKKLYPLKFRPTWKPKAWGGEHWDICGFEDEASLVSEGFLADSDLADILETYMGDLVGDEVFDCFNLYFPLLIKRLVVQDRLSVQVHPDDEVALQMYDSFGKTEFWYVMEAAPQARIYMGFREDTDASAFYKACKEGTVTSMLNVYEPHPGDCFFIKPGTVHAAGGGVTISEIQEASDMTFRLYDWGRENNPATRRQIHLDEALDSIDFRRYDEAACCGHLLDDDKVRVIVDCPHFIITSLPLKSPAKVSVEPFKSCVTYTCVRGGVLIETGDAKYTLTAGETILIPATSDDLMIIPDAGGSHLLQTHLPQPPKEDVYDGPEPEIP